MNSRQIEGWALRVIDCVKNGQPNEDFLVELKANWPELQHKAARRIAGHANAAGGENILWLIGVDGKKSGKECIVEIDSVEPSNWYPQIESCFDEIAPRMISLNIPVDGKIVVALLFETNRSPFVVKSSDGKGLQREVPFVVENPNKEEPDREVPWRENTALRTAKRSDLIRLLAPIEKLPEIEIIDLELNACIGGRPNYLGAQLCPDRLYLESNLYIVSKNRERVIIPFHRCKVIFKIGGLPDIESNHIEICPAGNRDSIWIENNQKSLTVKSTEHEIIIDGAGKVLLKVSAERPNLQDSDKKREVKISIYLQSVNTERPVILSTTLPYPEEKLPS
jgi:hypothetical protein